MLQLAPQNVQWTGAPDVGCEKDTLPKAPTATRTEQPEMTVVVRVGTANRAAPPVGQDCDGKTVGTGRGVAEAEAQYELRQLAGHVTKRPPWPA